MTTPAPALFRFSGRLPQGGAQVASLTSPLTTTSYMLRRRNRLSSSVPPMASPGRWLPNCPTTNYYALWQLAPFQGQLYLGYGTNCTQDPNDIDNRLTGPPGGLLAYMDSSQTWHSVLTVSDSINSMGCRRDTMLYFGTGYEVLWSTQPGIETGNGPGYVYAYAGNGATNATLISGIMGLVFSVYTIRQLHAWRHRRIWSCGCRLTKSTAPRRPIWQRLRTLAHKSAIQLPFCTLRRQTA